MKAMSDLLWRLTNRREMVNYGNGDVRDIPDEDCVEAAAELTSLREQCEAKDAEIERLKAERDEQGRNACDLFDEAYRLRGELTSLSAENERLREALESAESYLAFLDSCDEGSDEGPIVLAKVRAALAAHVGRINYAKDPSAGGNPFYPEEPPSDGENDITTISGPAW
jgi:hypothetical protein